MIIGKLFYIYNHAAEIALPKVGAANMFITATKYYRANALVDLGKFDEGMSLYDDVEKRLNYNPSNLEDAVSVGKCIDLVFSKAYAFLIWYDKMGNENYLQKSDSLHHLGLDALHFARNQVFEDRSSDFLMRKYRITFQNILLTKYNLI